MTKTSFLSTCSDRISGFRKNAKGQVAVMFAFAFVPMLGFVGGAIDYSRGTASLAQLNAAADAVALSAVTKARASATHSLPSDDVLRQFFNAAAGSTPGVTVGSFSVNCVNSAGTTVSCSGSLTGITVKVSYTATVDTVFMRALNVSTMSLSGSATASTNFPPYIDFFLLLDNSPSMGLAGSPADITALQNATGGCAFACHVKNADGSENTGDNYHKAKSTTLMDNGTSRSVKLRIDYLREAVQNLMDTATRSEASSGIVNQFKMAIYTFSDSVQTIATLSADLATQKTKAAAIDLAYSRFDQTDANTSFDRAFPKMDSSVIANAGNGLSASAPQKFLFFVTDGVQDELNISKSCTDTTDPLTTVTNCTPLINSNRVINLINSGLCDTIKASPRNIKIAVLYTPYLELNNAFYQSRVLPLDNGSSHTGIANSLRACASDGFFFQIDSTGNINAAMQAMFQSAVQYTQLTK